MPKDESIREASRRLCKESVTLRGTAKISLAMPKRRLPVRIEYGNKSKLEDPKMR